MLNPKEHWPYHSPQEIDAVVNVLASGRTNYWTGTHTKAFEKAYAAYVGVTHAVAISNGTKALEAALYALDIGPGDEVITSCRTFIASIACIVSRGARPVLADVDLISQNITVGTIEPLITKDTRAIIVVHLAGWPADMPSIIALAKRYGLKVIEDCAQAHGATFNHQQVGSFGDIAAFSFCQDKIISTGGEGGMITTNNEALWKKVWSYKDHGRNYDKVYAPNPPPGFRWLHDTFGTNLRMTEIQAVIGLAQLEKLPEWLAIRKRNVSILQTAFQSIPAFKVHKVPSHINHAFYKYYVFVQTEYLKPDWSRDRILQTINANGVSCFSGSCPDVGYEEAFKTINLFPSGRPNAKQLGETSLMFLVHPTISDITMQRVVKVVTNVMSEASLTFNSALG